MKKGLRKLFAYIVGMLTATGLKLFPWDKPLLDDNNFTAILITSNLLFVGANVGEHAANLPKDDDELIKRDNNLNGIERKLIGFISTFIVLVALVMFNRIGQDAFTYCFIANLGLFITGNLIGDHMIDGKLKGRIDKIYGSIQDIGNSEKASDEGNAKAE